MASSATLVPHPRQRQLKTTPPSLYITSARPSQTSHTISPMTNLLPLPNAVNTTTSKSWHLSALNRHNKLRAEASKAKKKIFRLPSFLTLPSLHVPQLDNLQTMPLLQKLIRYRSSPPAPCRCDPASVPKRALPTFLNVASYASTSTLAPLSLYLAPSPLSTLYIYDPYLPLNMPYKLVSRIFSSARFFLSLLSPPR